MTRRLLILEALAARVAAITVANGFETDAGEHVFLGVAPELSDGDPPTAIAILPRDDGVRESGPQFVILPVDVQAIARANLDQPWVAVELVIGDIKKAIELSDRTLGSLLKGDMLRGTTRTLERLPGSVTVGAGITYLCSYVEPWGAP